MDCLITCNWEDIIGSVDTTLASCSARAAVVTRRGGGTPAAFVLTAFGAALGPAFRAGPAGADVGNSIDYLLLQIREPKTRFKAARHQVARLDQPQLLKVVVSAFSGLKPAEFLWPFSPQTVRNRFRALLCQQRS